MLGNTLFMMTYCGRYIESIGCSVARKWGKGLICSCFFVQRYQRVTTY